MCFFNRFRWTCGHSQYALFELCTAARFSTSRSISRYYYHTTCRPKRYPHNYRKNNINNPCENCLKRSQAHGYHHMHNQYEHGTGQMADGYYPYYPGGAGSGLGDYGSSRYHSSRSLGSNFGLRSPSSRISPRNPDLCDAPNCRTVTTPKEVVDRGWADWARPTPSRSHAMGGRFIDDSYDPRWWNGGDDWMRSGERMRDGMHGIPMGYADSMDGFGSVPMGRRRRGGGILPVQVEDL